LAETSDTLEAFQPTLEEIQHWTGVMGRAQQLILEYAAKQAAQMPAAAPKLPDFSALWTNPQSMTFDTDKLADAQADFWKESLTLWQRFLDPGSVPAARGDNDRRFAAPQWRDLPLFDLIRQSYQIVSEHMLRSVEAIGGLAPKQQEQLRFATKSFVEAMSPSNFVATNPQALEKIITSRGESLLKGMENLLADLDRGQLTHSNRGAFEVGRDLASTPGKVIHETPLYQLIQYAPTTKEVAKIPLVIFPPWINRFYILDLKPEKSFVRWAVAEGLSVFMVSWKSADESIAHVTLDDYVAAQIDAVDTIRDLLGVEATHTIGYCVAGTTLKRSPAPPSSPRRWISPMPATSPCSSTTRSSISPPGWRATRAISTAATWPPPSTCCAART
jgi:polyhydroxyalkanoate synthase subunit PhaC